MNKCRKCGKGLTDGYPRSNPTLCVACWARAKTERAIEGPVTEFREAEITLRAPAGEADDRRVEIAFSSETPVERWYGREILDHNPKSVRLGRLRNRGPLLDGHFGEQVGVIEHAEIGQDRMGRVGARFSKANPRAEVVYQDVKDEIRTKASFWYRVHRMVLEEEKKDGPNTYRVTDWEPLEVSLVSVPADDTVGVGRSEGKPETGKIIVEEENRMEKCKFCGKEAGEGRALNADGFCPECEALKQQRANPQPPAPPAKAPAQPRVDADQVRTEERRRVAEIRAIGEKFSRAQVADKAVADGISVEEFRAQVLESLGGQRIDNLNPNIGMNRQEVQRYSFLRAINALVSGNWEKAGLERAVSDAVAGKLRKQPEGFFVAHDVMVGDLGLSREQQAAVLGRDAALSTTAPAAGPGANLIATNLMVGSFIEMLRNRMMVQRMGARSLTGLVGDVAIPKQTGGATAYWLGEEGEATESGPAYNQLGLTPKTVSAYTDISRKLLQQASMDVEALVRSDLATTLALAIDLVALTGPGNAFRPRGIINTTGVADGDMDTNGGHPDWFHIVQLETLVAAANADIGTMGYLTNAKVRGLLKTTEKATGTAQFIWENSSVPGEGVMNGYPARVSNQVPSNLTKGNATAVCSAIFFGNWADLILAFWGGLDVLVDPYSNSKSGTVRVVTHQDTDVAVRHAESFSVMADAKTDQPA